MPVNDLLCSMMGLYDICMSAPAPSFDASAARPCPACGYDLRAATGDRCPECGLILGENDMPWAYRSQIGRRAAFFLTARTILWPPRLCRAALRPVNPKSARKFAFVVAILSSLPVIAAVFLYQRTHNVYFPGPEEWLWPWQDSTLTTPITSRDYFNLFWHLGSGLWWVQILSVLLTFLMWIGIPALFFSAGDDNPTQRLRARSLTYYTCLPLLAIIIPCAGSIFLTSIYSDTVPILILLRPLALGCIYASPLVLLAWWWLALILIVRFARRRALFAALGMQVAFALSAAISLLALPCIAGFLLVVIRSLQS